MKISHTSLAEERSRTASGKFGNGHTVGKVVRDSKIMKDRAMYVIELDDKGNVIRHYNNPPFEKLLDCIVVLAPAKFQGIRVEQAVALEIGLSRFVPYRQTEIKSVQLHKKKQCESISGRLQVGILPWKVVEKLLPILWLAIQTCIDQKMEKWTRARFIQDRMIDRTKSGSKSISVYESWMSIRIPKDYPLIHVILRLKDESDKLRPGKNYAYVAEIIQKEFGVFRSLKSAYQGDYPDEILKKSNILWSLSGWIKKNIQYRGYTTRSIEAIRKLLKEKSSQDLFLFDTMCRVFKVPKAPPDTFLDTYEPLLGGKKQTLLEKCSLRPCRVDKYEKRRKAHAQECFTIAIIGSREHMERLDARNTHNRLHARQSAGENVYEGDSDIPFT